MKTKLCIGMILAVAVVVRAQTNSLTGLLQQGLFEEQANRNLDAAIADYQTLATKFDEDRQLAATAVFRLGECYRAQGRTNEAAAQYQRILRDFSDQTTLATLSQQDLAGMGMVKTEMAVAVENSDAQLWNKLKDMPQGDLEKVMPTLVPDTTLDTLLKQRDEIQAQRASTLVDYGPDSLNITRLDAEFKELDRQIKDKIDGMMQGLKLRTEISSSPEASKVSEQGAPPATDSEEDQEIARLQQMIQNSPDLIDVGGQDGLTPLSEAAKAGWMRVAAFLLDHGATLDPKALLYATSSGNRAMVEFLLDRGADVNAADSAGETALRRAAGAGYLSVAEVLIQHNANLETRNKGGETPLHRAATLGRPAMVALLLSKGADMNALGDNGVTPTVCAVFSGEVEVLDEFLKAGAKLDVEDRFGKTALTYAAQQGRIDVTKALLAAKADPNAGKNGATLFAALNQPQIVRLLLAAGASPNVKNDQGWTPLLSAIRSSQYDNVALLVQAGADVNAANENGMTPLQMAVWAQNIQIVSLLLSNNVDINARHPAGRTALEMSKEAEHGYRPYQPGDYGGGGVTQSDAALDRNISTLLREHGALDNLPNWNRITISSPSANFSTSVLYSGTNGFNHFTLLETIMLFYSGNGAAAWSPNRPAQPWLALPFPDFSRILIRRPNRPAGETGQEIKISLLDSSNLVDCARDVPVEFGDVIEIPESDHPLNAATPNPVQEMEDALAFGQQDTFQQRLETIRATETGARTGDYQTAAHCLQKSVQLVVAGETTTFKVDSWKQGFLSQALAKPEAQSVLRSSSDLSRVKVTRMASSPARAVSMTVDASGNSQPGDDLWLQDGDVIEVPDKP